MSNEIQKDDYYLPGNLGSVLIGGQRREIVESFAKKDGSVTLTIGSYEIKVVEDKEMPPGQIRFELPENK